MSKMPRWIVTQIGSREHYACPLGFHRAGRLKRLYTDVWAGPMLRRASKLVKMLEPVGRRYNPELPDGKVVGFNYRGLRYAMGRAAGDTEAQYQRYDEIGGWFATSVREYLKKRRAAAEGGADPADDMLYAFSTGALETLEYAKEIGLRTIVNQLDPARTDQVMIGEEAKRWPGWQGQPGVVPDSYFRRLSREWELADRVAVNSMFSKRSLVEQGCPAEKIFVVPLAYEPEAKAVSPRSSEGGGREGRPLQVLWLGQIVLRKGIPYLFEAARQLLASGENVHFSVAGVVGISEYAVSTAPANVTVLGKVPRGEAVRLFSEADVFVLPTISDGFAITQLEAMSHGVPVITTPNCGDVVSEGEDGFIVPIRSPEALAEKIRLLAGDRRLLSQLSTRAIEKSKQFTLERYTRVIEAEAATMLGR